MLLAELHFALKPMSTSDAHPPEDPKGRLDLLYRRHAAWLARRLAGVGIRGTEDIVQETYLRTAIYGGGEEIKNPKAFLFRVATNIVRDQAARTLKRGLAEGAVGFGRQESTASSENSFVLQQIILGLPEPLRDVFVMSRVGGLSSAQIAERLGISPKTVEWRMTKALAHCAAQLR